MEKLDFSISNLILYVMRELYVYGGKMMTIDEIRKIAQDKFFNYVNYCYSCEKFKTENCPMKEKDIQYDSDYRNICHSYKCID